LRLLLLLLCSLGDHMVPWHEAAEMFLALRACNIPAKHLIYDRALHNDFVLDWNPIRNAAGSLQVSTAAAAADAGAVGDQAKQGRVDAAKYGSADGGGRSSSSSTEALPAFARDLLAILTKQLKVRYETGSSEQTAAAVAALERAAGLPQLHQQQQRVVQDSTAAVGSLKDPMLSVPRPLSRL
jgi:hypothetical protein